MDTDANPDTGCPNSPMEGAELLISAYRSYAAPDGVMSVADAVVASADLHVGDCAFYGDLPVGEVAVDGAELRYSASVTGRGTVYAMDYPEIAPDAPIRCYAWAFFENGDENRDCVPDGWCAANGF